MFKRSLTIFLALLLLVSAALLPGCKKSGDESTSTGSQKEAAQEKTADEKFDPMAKYEPAIDTSWVRMADESLQNNVISKLGCTVENNVWTKLYADTLGINIKYNWIASNPEQNKQKLSVSIASGDIPDFMAVDLATMKQLKEADAIQPLGETYEKYAAANTKEAMLTDGNAPFDAATVDGKLMAIPRLGTSIDYASFIWIRADWLKNLNLPAPKTMDDVIKISEAFTKNDPDKNGKNDTIGLLTTKTLFDGFAGLAGFFNGYHAYPTNWVDDGNGKLVYGSIQPQVKEALAKLNELYTKGYMDKEFGVKDGGNAAEAAVNGKNGLFYGQHWVSLWPLQDCINNDPNADWKSYPIVSADSKPAKTQISLGTTEWFVANKKCKNPEALVKMLNLYVDKYLHGTPEDLETYINKNDVEGIWKLTPVNMEPAGKNTQIHLMIKKAIETKDESVLTTLEAKTNYKNVMAYRNGDKKNWGWNGVFGIDGSHATMDYYMKNDLFMMNGYLPAPTATKVEKGATLDKMELETQIKIIIGESPISEFDKFVENWKKLGGDKMTEEINVWYQSQKK